jgi:hypothetical protein
LFVVAASDVELTGLRVDRIVAPQVVVVGGSASGVAGALVHGNVFTGIARDVPAWGVIATAGSGRLAQRLRDVWVRRNRFVDVAQAITVSAGSRVGMVTAAANVTEDVHVVGNVIERPAQGLVTCGASIALGGSVADNVVQNLTVEHNRVTDGLDTSFIASTSCVIAGGTAARNRLVGIRYRRNTVVASPALGRHNAGLFLTGGQVALSNAGTDDGDRLDGLEFAENVVDGPEVGATVATGYVERCAGCAVTGGVLHGLRFTANVWRNVNVAIVLSAGAAGEAAGTVTDNVLSDVRVDGDDVAAHLVGLVVEGSNAFGLPLGGPFFLSGVEFPGYRQSATIADNRVRDVTFSDNRIAAADGSSIIGSISTATEDVVTRTVVSDVAFERNRFDVARSGIAVIGGLVDTSGMVTDSRVERVTGSGNRSGGDAVSVVALPELTLSGALPGSVGGNTVADVMVE